MKYRQIRYDQQHEYIKRGWSIKPAQGHHARYGVIVTKLTLWERFLRWMRMK